MRHGGQTLSAAADGVVRETLIEIGGAGTGGLVAVDSQGHVAMPFNTEGMYRASAVAGGARIIHIYRE
jgi:beta-aspartyl-peptidase (threonine type)